MLTHLNLNINVYFSLINLGKVSPHSARASRLKVAILALSISSFNLVKNLLMEYIISLHMP